MSNTFKPSDGPPSPSSAPPPSTIPPQPFKGNLALTGVVEILGHLSGAHHTGALAVTKMPEEEEARFYFRRGTLMRVDHQELSGAEVMVRARLWRKGFYEFLPGVEPPPLPPPTDEPEQRLDSARGEDDSSNAERKRSTKMAPASSTDIMEQMLQIPGITAVVVIGRDGFVIESVGGSERVDLDALGASLAAAINGIDEMGQELKVDNYQDLFVEYGKAMIVCRPLSDSIVAMMAPDATKLGIIRHKVKKPLDDLGRFF